MSTYTCLPAGGEGPAGEEGQSQTSPKFQMSRSTRLPGQYGTGMLQRGPSQARQRSWEPRSVCLLGLRKGSQREEFPDQQRVQAPRCTCSPSLGRGPKEGGAFQTRGSRCPGPRFHWGWRRGPKRKGLFPDQQKIPVPRCACSPEGLKDSRGGRGVSKPEGPDAQIHALTGAGGRLHMSF